MAKTLKAKIVVTNGSVTVDGRMMEGCNFGPGRLSVFLDDGQIVWTPNDRQAHQRQVVGISRANAIYTVELSAEFVLTVTV